MTRRLVVSLLGFSMWVTVGCGPAAGAPGASGNRASGYLQEVQAAYFDLKSHAPAQLSCEMRSPELVASFDDRARRAWGHDGHVVMEQGGGGLRLRAAGLAQPGAEGIFNIVLAAWQLRLGAELAQVQRYLPATTLATALGVLASPWTHEFFDQPTSRGRRIGWRARKPDYPVQEVAFEIGAGQQIHNAYLLNRDSSTIDLRLDNETRPWTGERWLVTRIDAEIRDRAGKVERLLVDLDYQTAGAKVFLETFRILREDENGRPIRKNEADINPIGFHFSKCSVSRAVGE